MILLSNIFNQKLTLMTGKTTVFLCGKTTKSDANQHDLVIVARTLEMG